MADWQRVKSIFEELVDLSSEQRPAVLSRLCAGDAELRAAVDRLLESHEQAGEFLGAPTGQHRVAEAFPPNNGLPDLAPPRVGYYTPIEKIGEGGFGTVYRAQQESPVRRVVALKVIKAGMDTREVIARFQSERQALAMMSHPNIAAVLDAGATSEGRPYFVMEYVPGEPITTYSDKNRLSLRQRLDLFIQVCHAVQHAHQKGIIHRDIKPSNVLVVDQATVRRSDEATEGNGPTTPCQPVAKVIDFGVAKATDQRLTEHSVLTQEGVLVGTPEYMSPEQAEPGLLDIDTRTDIYSLGVLLYELLTGTLPFSPKTLRSKGFAEIQRMVREVEPPKPSTRFSLLLSKRSDPSGEWKPEDFGDNSGSSSADRAVSQTLAGRIADCRNTDPAALSRALRGDLDWIVMKCLEKDRARRYETANGVALEVERYLKNEPVLAGPPGAAYRLSKFIRRNRVALAAISAVAVALAIGLMVSIAGFMAAVRARDVADEQRRLAQRSAEDARQMAEVAAEQERIAQSSAADAHRAAAKAEAVNQFLQDTLSEADPRYSAQREITVRESLDRAVARLDTGAMKNEPEIEAAIRLTIGRTYTGLAQVAAAETQIEAAVRAYRELTGEESPEYADAVHQRAYVRKLAGRPVEAEDDLRVALAIQRQRGKAAEAEAATCASDLAVTLLDQKKYDEGERLLQEVLLFARRPENNDKSILAESVNNMGSLHLARQEFDAAEPLFREAIEVNRRLVGNLHPNVATNFDNLAQVLYGKGDVKGAEAAYEEALSIRRELFGADHPDLATTLHNLAVLYHSRGDLAACEKALRESLAIFRRTYGLTHRDTLTVLHSLVSVVGGSGQPQEAETLLNEAFDAVLDDPSVGKDQAAYLAQRLSQLYDAWSRPEDSANWKQRAEELNASKTDSTGEAD